jgi:hypothetical protein
MPEMSGGECLRLALDIALELSTPEETWTLAPNATDAYPKIACGGAVVTLSFYFERAQRVKAYGDYGDADRWTRYETTPSITMLASRGARSIAADIRSRLLPDYRALLQKVRQKKADHEETQAAIRATGERVVAASGGMAAFTTWNVSHGEAPENFTDRVHGKPRFEGSVCSSRVDLKITDLRVDEAEEVLRLLRAFHVRRMVEDTEGFEKAVASMVRHVMWRIEEPDGKHILPYKDAAEMMADIEGSEIAQFTDLPFVERVVTHLAAKGVDIADPNGPRHCTALAIIDRPECRTGEELVVWRPRADGVAVAESQS